jgi:hypothetical protein
MAAPPAAQARVLRAMGFTRFVGPMPRGGLSSFPPVYRPFIPWRRRLAPVDSYSPEAAAAWDADDLLARERVRAINHDLNRRPCLLLVRDAPDRWAVYLDQASGEWATPSGGAYGDDITSLGAAAWNCSPGWAASRIAQVLGLKDTPYAK